MVDAVCDVRDENMEGNDDVDSANVVSDDETGADNDKDEISDASCVVG